jgi:hypothetical protein
MISPVTSTSGPPAAAFVDFAAASSRVFSTRKAGGRSDELSSTIVSISPEGARQSLAANSGASLNSSASDSALSLSIVDAISAYLAARAERAQA